MENKLATPPPNLFPAALIQWSGHRGGGVRKPFFDGAGRPCTDVIKTPLLARLQRWTDELAEHSGTVPRSILLVGGPGNGKTEAVEQTIRALDTAFVLEGKLIARFTSAFEESGKDGSGRRIDLELDGVAIQKGMETMAVVQDASMSDSRATGKSAAELFLGDLQEIVEGKSGRIYLACINRGILDDALMLAHAGCDVAVRRLLEAVVGAVEIKPSAPSCWPLTEFPSIAVWPMDIESLFVDDQSSTIQSPASQILRQAIRADAWAPHGTCPAHDRCPFCSNRELLGDEVHSGALLQILRWSELALCKRWSFRDLFSLYSHLLAGSVIEDSQEFDPCQWAAKLVASQSDPANTPSKVRSRFKSPFVLASALYQHGLFGEWQRPNSRSLKKEIADVKMTDDPGIMGLYYFLSSPSKEAITGTLQAQLKAIGDAMDPALADPDSEIVLSKRKLSLGGQIDGYFSQSVGEGLQECRADLHLLEVDVLLKLAETDRRLSNPDATKSFPVTAKRLQGLIRNFSSRLVRRSLGVRYGCVRDQAVLAEYQKVVEGNPQLVHKAAKQVEGLLNENERFAITLNSTFGEPNLPLLRRALLITAKQKVKASEDAPVGRPASILRFLKIGSGKNSHTLALTYELFRAVHELRRGLLPASLPRAVVAQLDTSKSKLAGTVVRSDEVLEDAEIRLGSTSVVVRQELNQFVVSRGD